MGCDNGIPEYKHYTSSASAFLKEEGFGLGSSPGLRSLPPGPERDFLTLSWGPIIYRTSYAPDTKRLLPVFLRCLNDAVGQSSRPEASVDHGGGCGPNSLSPFSCRRTAWPNFISPRRTLLAMATAVVGRLSLVRLISLDPWSSGLSPVGNERAIRCCSYASGLAILPPKYDNHAAECEGLR